MNFTVYTLFNSKTCELYIGMTGRSLEQRKYEHMRCSGEKSSRQIVEAVRRNPNTDEWVINPLWVTPVYPECREMEAALIEQFGISASPLYTLLNEQTPNTVELCSAAAHSIVHGMPVLIQPYEHHIHHEYPDVVLYQRWNEDVWTFGYRGRGKTDTQMLWWCTDTEETDLDSAMHYTTRHFDESYLYIEPEIDIYEDRFDLQKQKISNILKPLEFETLDEVNSVFGYIEDLKQEIVSSFAIPSLTTKVI